jgi:uncharacterized protein (TIGR03435 family)
VNVIDITLLRLLSVLRSFLWITAFFALTSVSVNAAPQQKLPEEANVAGISAPIAAVSIHPLPSNRDNTGYGGGYDGSYFRAHAYSIEMLIRSALGIEDSTRIRNLPKWATIEKYDILATIDDQNSVSFRKQSGNDQAKQIELAILATRFHFKFHYALAKRPVFFLLEAKSGLRNMKQVQAQSPDHQNSPCIWPGRGPGYLKADSCSIQDLATALNVVDDRQVLDKTNMEAHFAFELHFNSAATSSIVNGTRFAAQPDRTSEWPSIYSALTAQLGLRLVPASANVPVAIIDNVTLPTGN